MSAAEQELAYQDVESVVAEFGNDISFFPGGEANVARDDYGSVIRVAAPSAGPTAIKSFPIRFNPTEKQLQRAGILERADVIFWLASKQLEGLGITFLDIDTTRARIQYQGVEYRITQKGQASQFGSVFLYVTLGGVRS